MLFESNLSSARCRGAITSLVLLATLFMIQAQMPVLATWPHSWLSNNTPRSPSTVPKRRTIPSAAPVTRRLPLWLKAVQLIAMGSGSRENCSWKGKSALMLRNGAGGAEKQNSRGRKKERWYLVTRTLVWSPTPLMTTDFKVWQQHFTVTPNQQFTSAKPQLSWPWPQSFDSSFWQALA